MSRGGGVEKEFVEERVAFTVNPERPDHFIPRISVSKTSGNSGRVEKSFRPIEPSDVARILDYESVPDPPPDGAMMHGEMSGGDINFPQRHFCIRGGFLFYFDETDITGSGQSHYVEYHGAPIGVIPLDKVTISLPPGGRRVFREHAQTNAKTGYEIAILHGGSAEGGDGNRPPAFIAAKTLQLRERWADAIKARAGVERHTKLRTVFNFSSGAGMTPQDMLKKSGNSVKTETSRKTKKGKKNRKFASSDEKGEGGNENLVQGALEVFGKSGFNDKGFVDNYFEKNSEKDAEDECRLMDLKQLAIKKGLKTAILEQYEYFVEASAEMTKMGKEVGDLKNMVETQVETIKVMKEIDFGLTSALDDVDENASFVDDGDGLFNDPRDARKSGGSRRRLDDDQSDASSVSSNGGEEAQKFDTGIRYRDPDSKEGVIEIPSYLDDSTEEITAFVKESRYTDATDLWAKAKKEVAAIVVHHDTRNHFYLTQKQFAQVQKLISSLEDLAEMISNRLVENLRRKNEALKQASKRERSAASTQMVPSVSPCCLNDDLVSLRLLVKLGKTQDAATAYSARRSLLLLESLHERPLAGTGNVDLVIYAAQLSQSFFSCLAGAIEGFLDLFLAGPTGEKGEGSIGADGGIHDLPAGALASIVLWCDAELSKFAAAFGGARILGNLPLSPPPREAAKKGPRVLGKANGGKDRESAIETAAECVSQAFQYASENLDTVGLPLTPRLAESLRKRLKGCESEVAKSMDEQWRAIVLEWEFAMDDDGRMM
mmetsp:Transcript_2400/g.5533  ORF Transcript_2400/g.5533 Transcript_2400/m.5533 type:complete len:772 (+) Transcript_2400:160-2475(+)